MPRRPIGKIRSASGSLVSRSSGRRVSGFGALIVAIAAVPAWWTLGGGTIPEISGNAFDSPGAIGFFAALVVLAILVAPEAVGRDLPLDRWPVLETLTPRAGGERVATDVPRPGKAKKRFSRPRRAMG